MINIKKQKIRSQGGEGMKKIEQIAAKTAWKLADASINIWGGACTFILYQPKVTEQLKKRLKETKQKH